MVSSIEKSECVTFVMGSHLTTTSSVNGGKSRGVSGPLYPVPHFSSQHNETVSVSRPYAFDAPGRVPAESGTGSHSDARVDLSNTGP